MIKAATIAKGFVIAGAIIMSCNPAHLTKQSETIILGHDTSIEIIDEIFDFRDHLPEIMVDEEDNVSNEKPAPEREYFYKISDYERTVIEQVVMAESGTESYQGQCAIAQCIIDACKLEDKRPIDIIIEYQYTKNRHAPSESVKKAVAAVFDDGYRVTQAKTLYFYAPKLVVSTWHESMNFVIQIGNVRFFN